MENFSAIVIWDWSQASQFVEKLMLLNKCHNMCTFNLDTDEYGNLTDKGTSELLAIFKNKERTIKYFTENLNPSFSDRNARLEPIQAKALSDLLVRCYELFEKRGMDLAYSLYNNYVKNYHSFSTPYDNHDAEDWEVDECNRLFNDMMDENNAWGNLD